MYAFGMEGPKGSQNQQTFPPIFEVALLGPLTASRFSFRLRPPTIPEERTPGINVCLMAFLAHGNSEGRFPWASVSCSRPSLLSSLLSSSSSFSSPSLPLSPSSLSTYLPVCLPVSIDSIQGLVHEVGHAHHDCPVHRNPPNFTVPEGYRLSWRASKLENESRTRTVTAFT